jgi:putative glycosyltransferase (TIGR04372 family)
MRLVRRLLGRQLGAVCGALAPAARLLQMRFFYLDGGRIGDLGASLAWFAQARGLSWTPRFRGIMVPIPRPRLANRCYADYWREHFRIVTTPLLYQLAFRLASRSDLGLPVEPVTLPDGTVIGRDTALTASQRQWELERRPPLLALRADHARRGHDALASFGMKSDSWFVALHVREAGYLNEPPDSYRLHRNADVDTYLPAVERITDRGGWVIRMGDPTMKPLPEMENVVDYVHSPIYNDWMDVFLAASCRFFLGSSSGLFVVSWTFGRPCALANWDSLITRPWASTDLFIPKLWWLSAQERYLTWPEQIADPFLEPLYVSRTRPKDFEQLGLSPVDSSPDEITQLVEEMFQRETGASMSPEDEKLHASFEEIVEPHYPCGTSARIGTDFLRRHRDLMRPAGGAVSADME